MLDCVGGSELVRGHGQSVQADTSRCRAVFMLETSLRSIFFPDIDIVRKLDRIRGMVKENLSQIS